MDKDKLVLFFLQLNILEYLMKYFAKYTYVDTY